MKSREKACCEDSQENWRAMLFLLDNPYLWKIITQDINDKGVIQKGTEKNLHDLLLVSAG